MSETSDLSVAREGRLDQFLRTALPHASVRQLRRLAADGLIRINGRIANKGDRVRGGDVVRVPAELVVTTSLRAESALAIPILFEDEQLVAIDKPCGMPSVARNLLDTGTAANFLVARFPETRSLDRGELEAGLVHRLDTATSGALVAARTEASYRTLGAQFRGGDARKTYVAVVDGVVHQGGVICDSIRSRPRDPSRVEVVPDGSPDSRRATTQFRPMSSTAARSLIEVEIESGARHQIRAHLASIGHPIVGDELYGNRTSGRLLLHASSVAFAHPDSGRPTTIHAPTPAEFSQRLDELST